MHQSDYTGENTQSYDVIVLGAGVSGLVLAATLVDQGHKVALVDDYPEPGGNHLSWNIDDCTFDVGAIFFWTDSPLLNIFPGIFDEGVDVDYSIRKISPAHKIISYPIDLKAELFGRGAAYLARVFSEIAIKRITPRRTQTATDYLAYHIGDTMIRDTGLAFYVQRFYGRSPDHISFDFGDARMRWVSTSTSLHSLARKGVGLIRRNGVSPEIFCIGRPKGGFPRMYRKAVDFLEDKGVDSFFSAHVLQARGINGDFEVTIKNSNLRAPRLLSTLPLSKTVEMFGIDVAAAPVSSTLLTLFCTFRGSRGFDSLILYNFGELGTWKRLTMHSDYYGQSERGEYFCVEVIEMTPLSPETAFLDFVDSARAYSIFDGQIELIGSARTEFAYPIYDQESLVSRDLCLHSLAVKGVEMVGRQGRFDYIPSSTLATELAQRSVGFRHATDSPS